MSIRTRLSRAFAVLGLALGAAAVTAPAHADEDVPPPAASAAESAAPSPAASAAADAPKPEASNAPHQEAAHPAPAASGSAGSDLSAQLPPGFDPPDEDGELSKDDELEGNKLGLGCQGGEEDACTKLYASWIRKIIPKVKEKALEKIEDKMEASQAKKMQTLSTALFAFSATGFLLLLMPLFLKKKYPGKGSVLFKFSAIAAFSTVIVMDLFAVVVLLLKAAQSSMGKLTNPQIKIVVAALDSIEQEAEHMVTMGPQLIQPTLDHLQNSDDPMPVVLLENAKNIAKDVQPFVEVAQWFKGLSSVLEYVPVLMTGIAVFLFVVGAKPIILELIALPGRAAAGDDTKGMIAEAFRKVGREFMAAMMLIGALVVVTLFSSEMLAIAVRPAVSSFLDYFFANIIYVQHPGAKSSHIFGSLLGIVFFLALNIGVIIVSSSTFLSKFHKIFQAKFQRSVPLGNHKKFWIWGTLSLVGVQLFPFIFMLGAEPLVDSLTDKAFAKDEPNWTLALLSGPVIFVIGFLFLFWLFRGMKAFGFLFTFKPEPPAPKAAEPAPEEAKPAG